MSNQRKELCKESIVEIMQDLVCFVYILEVVKRQKNIEAKNYVSLFLKTILPVIEYEIAIFFDETQIISKNDFFNPGMKKRVFTEREAIKRIIVNSSKPLITAQEMGLNFNEKVYDMNIKIYKNTLQDMNYETYVDNVKNSDFWLDLFSSPKKVLTAMLMGLNYDISIDELISALDDSIVKTSLDFDEKFDGERLSYSVYKLFSQAAFLTNRDKIFILYRYRMVTSVLAIEKNLPKLEIKKNNDIIIDFHSFFRKWKAMIVEIIGKELSELKTDFSLNLQRKIDDNIVNKKFFQYNRKLRNNLHYTTIEILSQKALELIDSGQKIYFDILTSSFENCLYIDVDKECRTMTGFLKACQDKELPPDEITRNYYYYYIKYLLFKHL